MTPPPHEHVAVLESSRPNSFRVRVLGGSGGELVVSREELAELVIRGGEALKRTPKGT